MVRFIKNFVFIYTLLITGVVVQLFYSKVDITAPLEEWFRPEWINKEIKKSGPSRHDILNLNIKLKGAINDIKKGQNFNAISKIEFSLSFLNNIYGSEWALSQSGLEYVSGPRYLKKSSSHLGSLVTILLDGCQEFPEEEVGGEAVTRIVGQIRHQWADVKIVVGVNQLKLNDLSKIHNRNNVFVTEVNCDSWNRAPIKPFLPYINSPYVLFLESVAAVTKDLNITRLISALEDSPGAKVIGLSQRGSDGGWDYTCFQLQRQNADLSIVEGYRFSNSPCIYCDVTSSSFLAEARILETLPPDDSLPTPVQQVDWGLRMQAMNTLSMTCPDVMVHSTRKIVIPLTQTSNTKKEIGRHSLLKSLYLKFAQKAELNTIRFRNGTILEYNCDEIKFDCRPRSRVRQALMLPPCCLKIKLDLLKAYHTFAHELSVPYELIYGSLLAAVKFKGPIPWDFDDDVIVTNSDFSIFKNNLQKLNDLGFPARLSSTKNGNDKKYMITTSKNGLWFDVFSVSQLSEVVYNVSDRDIPKDIPCLLFGYYPIPIKQFLQYSGNISTLFTIIDETSLVHQAPAKTSQIYTDLASRKPRCLLQSFVRMGDLWLPAPMNPGLKSLKKFGEGLFTHEAHWRVPLNKTDVWPQCKVPGYVYCLDSHPIDGSIPFY